MKRRFFKTRNLKHVFMMLALLLVFVALPAYTFAALPISSFFSGSTSTLTSQNLPNETVKVETGGGLATFNVAGTLTPLGSLSGTLSVTLSKQVTIQTGPANVQGWGYSVGTYILTSNMGTYNGDVYSVFNTINGQHWSAISGGVNAVGLINFFTPSADAYVSSVGGVLNSGAIHLTQNNQPTNQPTFSSTTYPTVNINWSTSTMANVAFTSNSGGYASSNLTPTGTVIYLPPPYDEGIHFGSYTSSAGNHLYHGYFDSCSSGTCNNYGMAEGFMFGTYTFQNNASGGGSIFNGYSEQVTNITTSSGNVTVPVNSDVSVYGDVGVGNVVHATMASVTLPYSNFELQGYVYNISTDFPPTFPLTICLNSTSANTNGLSVYHYDSGTGLWGPLPSAPCNLTPTNLCTTQTICGYTNSLSPFGIGFLTSPSGGGGSGGGTPTPVGYSPQWLAITLVSLILAGWYLLRRKQRISIFSSRSL